MPYRAEIRFRAFPPLIVGRSTSLIISLIILFNVSGSAPPTENFRTKPNVIPQSCSFTLGLVVRGWQNGHKNKD